MAAIALAVAMPASPVQADPSCVNNGAYVLFARGSGAGFDSGEALTFKNTVRYQLSQFGVGSEWAELGNLDNDGITSNTEYPAVPWTRYASGGLNLDGYGNSVTVGTNELVKHLNYRYGTATGNWVSNCHNEVVVLGGFSQGADAIGWALERHWNGNRDWSLAPETRRHIAHVALYGDPRADCTGPWMRTDCRAIYAQAEGALGKRIPYVPSDIGNRLGSWCDPGDTICGGRFFMDPTGGTHGSVYQNGLIASSSREVALQAISKLIEMGMQAPISFSYELLSQLPFANGYTPPAPVPQSITPTAITRNERTMDVFYKSNEGNLVARGWDVDFDWNYQWWPFELAGNPVAVARKPGAMDVFWRGAGGSLWNFGWDYGAGGWHAPVKLVDSCVVGDPAVVSRSEGSMDVFWRSCNNELKNVHWNWQDSWGNVITLVGANNVYSNPTVTSRRADLMDVFYKGPSNNLVNLGWKSADSWYAPQTRCTNIAGNPKAVNRGLNAMSVFYRTPGSRLAECGWDGGVGWFGQEWASPTAGDPAVVVRDQNHMSVFYRESDGGKLMERWMDSGTWGLQSWNDQVTSAPAVVSRTPDTMDVFFRSDATDAGGNALVNRGWNPCCSWERQVL
jgi:hypothetical protein